LCPLAVLLWTAPARYGGIPIFEARYKRMVTNLARNWGARILLPIARLLSGIGLTPNAVTVLGLALTVGVAVILASGQLVLGGLLLIATLAFDAVDGTLARLTGQTTRFGAFLDSTLDRWAEIALYAALVWHYLHVGNDLGVMLAVAALSTSLMVSYTRARAEGIGVTCKEGILTRFERMLILIIGLVFSLDVWALGIIAILAAFTAVQRILVTYQAARSPTN
jgi:CDP-diacylglycerol---glycerol-3-phosphate 3-phosphatidyltransferase